MLSSKNTWYLLLTLAACFAGSIYTVTKLIAPRFSALSLAFIRYFFALIPMVPFFIIVMKRKTEKITTRDYLFIFLIGIFGIAGFSLLFFFGVIKSTATNGSMLVNTQPIFAVFLAPLIVGEKFTVKNVAGALFGLLGITLLITGGNWGTLSFGSEVLVGNLLLLGASLVLTLYAILLKRYIIRYGGIIPTFLTVLSGTVILGMVARFFQGYIIDFESFRAADLLPLSYIGIFCTAYFFMVFNKGLEVLDVIGTIGFKFLIPVVGITFSIIILKERPTAWAYAAIFIVLASIVVLQWNPSRKCTGG